MNQIAVIYKSKYGSTKQYAQWIAARLGADLFAYADKSTVHLEQYHTVFYGGGIYASGIAGFSFVKKNFSTLKNKRLIVFAVGATEEGTEVVECIKKINFTPEMSDIPFHYLRGACDYKKMTLRDRLFMSLLKKTLNKKPKSELQGWEQDLLCESFDGKNEAKIQPLLDEMTRGNKLLSNKR